jgi:hypothetical protein
MSRHIGQHYVGESVEFLRPNPNRTTPAALLLLRTRVRSRRAKEKPRRVRPGFFAWSASSWRRFRSRRLAGSACHLTSRLAGSACHLTSSLAGRACRLAGSARRLASRLASSARHLPSCPADSACCLARGTSCRRHKFLQFCLEVTSARWQCGLIENASLLCLRTGQVNIYLTSS